MTRGRFCGVALAIGLICGAAGAADAQQQYAVGEADARAPRFLLAASSRGESPILLDVRRTPVLTRRIAVDLDGVPLSEALAAIASQAGLTLVYADGVVQAEKRVHLKAEQITVVAALTDVLADVGVDVVFNTRGGATLVKRTALEGVLPAVGTISGTVTEAATGNAVAQAQVSVSGTSRGATSGEDGRYSVTGVPAGRRTVTVRRLGYDMMSREVEVRDAESVTADFALVGATTRLAEIITTVTGGQRRMELGHAIGRIQADSIAQNAPVMSLGDLLNGREPGLISHQEGGLSGRAGTLRLRGLNSLVASNDPVVIMDGVRIESSKGNTASTNTDMGGGGQTGRLGDIDPNEIASVEVVKGPSASTLYGTDATNGVIVITTKRGQANTTRWVVRAEGGLVTQDFDYKDQFADGYYAFGRSVATNAPQRCMLLQRAAATCVVDSLKSFNTFKDPVTKPFKDAWRQHYGLQLSGGTAAGVTYFLSGDFADETGTLYMPEVDQEFLKTRLGVAAVPEEMIRPNVDQRANVRANLTMPLSRRSSITVSTAFIEKDTRMHSFASVWNFGGGQVGYRDANDGWLISPTTNQRPAYAFNQFVGEERVRRFVSSGAVSHSLSESIALRATAGVDLSSDSHGYLVRPEFDYPTAGSPGQRQASELGVTRYSMDAGGTHTRMLKPTLSAKTSIGAQYNRRSQRGTRMFVANLPLGGRTVAGGSIGQGTQLFEATFITAVAGGYIEEILGLRERLFVTAALRFDGASAFGEKFSVATYPKASVSWIATDGDKGFRIPGANMLRLRAAFGVAGVQPGPTDALTRITPEAGVNLAGTASVPGAFVVAGNPYLRPELSSEWEGGVDAELFVGRVRAEVTGYHRKSSHAFVRRTNAPSVFGTLIENLGSVRNRGLELLLSGDVLRSTNFTAGVRLTGLLNENTLLELGEGVVASAPAVQGARIEEGFSILGKWGRTFESFADANGNGIIEASEMVVRNPNAVYYGPGFPTREATVGPYLNLLKDRLSLSGLLQYRGNFFLHRFCGNAFVGDHARVLNDISTPLDEQASCIALRSLGLQGPSIEDASFLAWRELSAAITLPRMMLRRMRANSGSLVLTGRNIRALWKASDLPIETANGAFDSGTQGNGQNLGPHTYWLARFHLTF